MANLSLGIFNGDESQPNPTLARRIQPEWIGRSVALALIGASLMPFTGSHTQQGEWPNPVIKRVVQQPDLFPNRLPLLTGSPSRTFAIGNLLGAPPATGARSGLGDGSGLKGQRIQTALPFSVNAPQGQNEWLLPVRAKPWWYWNIDPPNRMAEIIRPFINRILQWDNPQQPKPRAQVIDAPNVTITLPHGTVAAPFDQTDWPNPNLAGKTFNWHYPQAQNLLSTLLLPNLGTPETLSDFPNPRGAARYPQWGDAPNVTLGLPPGPVPFVQGDQPNPPVARAGGRLTLDSPGLLNTLLFPSATAVPFGLEDWPITRLARQAAQPDTIANRLALTAQPFDLTEWPNPLRAALRTQVDSAVNRFPLTAQPFNQDDWTNPQGRIVRAYPDFKGAVLPFSTLAPFRQADWANPRWTIARQYPDPLNVLPQRSFTFPPFSQHEWPNPRGYARASDLVTWLMSMRPELVPTIARLTLTDNSVWMVTLTDGLTYSVSMDDMAVWTLNLTDIG